MPTDCHCPTTAAGPGKMMPLHIWGLQQAPSLPYAAILSSTASYICHATRKYDGTMVDPPNAGCFATVKKGPALMTFMAASTQTY